MKKDLVIEVFLFCVLLSLDGARTLINKRFEAVTLINEVVVDEVDKHVH